MEHGGGMPWQPPTYDPGLNLLYVSTAQSRKGDNLWTASIVALNPDDGKLAWAFQTSPHDTHDWDAAQVPVLIDGTINGQPRKMVGQANRNGFYFLLDRTNGKNLLTKPFAESMNWYQGVDQKGSPIPVPIPNSTALWFRLPQRESRTGRRLRSAPIPDCFYVGTERTYSIYYLTDATARPQGFGPTERRLMTAGNHLRALGLQDGRGQMEGPDHQRNSGSSQHRRIRQFHRLRRGERKALVACRYWDHLECSFDLHA